jgi:DNA-binding winged helix-turn-helix (wHTH) protein
VVYVFGDHELDEGLFRLRRAGRTIVIQPKVLSLLLYLVRNRDRVVSKDEILAAVWPDVVVTHNSLMRAVSLARSVIGDRDRKPPAIATVPRRGYRFQGTVVERAASSAPVEDVPADYVGRASLVERLGVRLDAALGGHGGLILLVGEEGIGKTRTAEVLAARARRSGSVVVCTCRLEARAPTYTVWRRTLHELVRERPGTVTSLPTQQRDHLATLIPELATTTRLASRRDARTGEDERVRMFDAVLALLAAATAKDALVLVLDDVLGADVQSLGLLEHVAQSIGDLPIAIIATGREGEEVRPPRLRALAGLARVRTFERWPLPGLDRDGVYEFAKRWVRRHPDPELVEALVRTTRGNPLLLGESLRSLEARALLDQPRDQQAWEALLPEGIQHLLRPRMRSLSASALSVLACASAIGLEVDRRLLARAHPETADLEECLRELRAAGFLASAAPAVPRLRFVHRLVRDALYEALLAPGDDRRACHARIAAALEQDARPGDDALAGRAHHACEAAPLVDPGYAGRLARAAGDSAARLLDLERAAFWYARALDMLHVTGAMDRSLRAQLYLALAAAQTPTVGHERARLAYREAIDDARAAGRGDVLAEAVLGLAYFAALGAPRDPELIALLEEAAAACAAHPSIHIRVRARLAAALSHGDLARAEGLIDAAVDDARRLGDPAVLAQALDDSCWVRCEVDSAALVARFLEIARYARVAGDLERELRARRYCVTGLLEQGDLDAVDRELSTIDRVAERLRTPFAGWLSTSLRTMRLLLAGDLVAGERGVEESMRLAARVESPDVVLLGQVQLAYLRLETGEGGELAPFARLQVERFPGRPEWRAALARLWLAAGRPDEARSELEHLARELFVSLTREGLWLPTLALAAEVAHATGEGRIAERLAVALEPFVGTNVVLGDGLLYYGPVAHHLGLLAATRSRWDEAIARFEVAQRAERQVQAGIWTARTELAWARALLARQGPGDRARAARLATSSGDAARTHGLPALLDQSRVVEAMLWSGGERSSGARREAGPV